MDDKLNAPSGPVAGPPLGPTPPVNISPKPEVPKAAPPKPPGSTLPFFDIFSFIPFIIGIVVIITLVFVSIKVLPGFFSKQSNETITLSYWGLWEDQNVIRVVLSDFEREHPNIKVDYKKWDVKQYRETLASRIQQGIGPDLFRFHNSWLPMFKEMLSPVPKDVLNTQELNNVFPQVVAQDLEDKGALYGIPLSIDTLALFVNTDLYSQDPPKTWEELQKIATTQTSKDDLGKIKTAGVALGTFDNINHASDIIALMVLQNHGSLTQSSPDSPTAKNARDAICYYISFAKNNNAECTKGDAFIWDDAQDTSILSFAKGSLGMYFGYSWDIFAMRALNPNLHFKVFPTPQLPNQNLNIASFWVEGVSKKGKHQKEAFELLKFLTKKETVQKLYTEEAKTRLFGEPYARLDLAETLKNDPILSVFVGQAKTAVSTPFSSDTFDNGLNQELNNYLGDLVRKILGNTSVTSAYETLSSGVNATYTKYGIQKGP